jgi:hypothetical protein
MEEKVIRIVVARLRRYGELPMNEERLAQIREDVYKATRTNKFASFVNVKKWVKEARKVMKTRDRARAPAKAAKRQVFAKAAQSVDDYEAPAVSRRVEDSVNLIKAEAEPGQEVQLAKPTIVFDKVYLQSIKFEIAGIRQTMERVSRQLDKLEKELSNHGEE